MMDPNGDGVITADKLRRVSVAWGLGFTDDEIENMIEEADSSGKGYVKLTELDNLMETSKVAMEAEGKLQEHIDEAFSYFDTGQVGHIKATDLGSALRMASVNPTPQDVRDMLRKLGYPRTITYLQFKRVTRQASKNDHLRLVAAIQCFDPNNTGYLSPDKLRQILQPTAGKAFTSFTKQDMEDIIVKFTRRGRIDTEVFVHYLMGQEQYLPVDRQLPPTPEQSSLLRLRKDSGSDFGIDNQLSKTEIQPKLNAAFRRKLKYYQELKRKQELERQKEAIKYSYTITKDKRIRKRRLKEIPEENLQSRNEGKVGVIEEDDENENVFTSDEDANSINVTNDSSGLVSGSEDSRDKRRATEGMDQTERKPAKILKVRHTNKTKQQSENKRKDGNLPETKKQIRIETKDKHSNKVKQHPEKRKNEENTNDKKKQKQTETKDLQKSENTKNDGNVHDERKQTETKDKQSTKGKQETENKEKDENIDNEKKQKQAETKESDAQNQKESIYKQNKYSGRPQKKKGYMDLHREEKGKSKETNKDQIKLKEKQRTENEMKNVIRNKIVGYAERHLYEKMIEKQKALKEKSFKNKKAEEIPHTGDDNSSDIIAIVEPPSYAKLKEIKQKYKEENQTEIKHQDIPEEKVSNNDDNINQPIEPKVKSYFELHVKEKQNVQMKEEEEVAIEPDEKTIAPKTIDDSFEELNANEKHTKGYCDLHRNDTRRRIQFMKEDISPSHSPEDKPHVNFNANDDNKMEEEKPTYAKLNEVSRKYKSNEKQSLPVTDEITEPLAPNHVQVELHAKKEKGYIELHRPDERVQQIHVHTNKQEEIPFQEDESQKNDLSDNMVMAKDDSNTYAKLSELRRKNKLEELKDIDERQHVLETDFTDKYVVKETLEVKPKGYAELHRVDEKHRNKGHDNESVGTLNAKQTSLNESVENPLQNEIPEEEVKGYTDIHKTNAKLRQQTKQTEQNILPSDKVDNTIASVVVDNSNGYVSDNDNAVKERPTYLKLSEQSKKHYEQKEKDTILESNHHELIVTWEEVNKEAVKPKQLEELNTYAKINETARKHYDQNAIQPQSSVQMKEFEDANQHIVTVPQKPKGYADLHTADGRVNNLTKEHASYQQAPDVNDNIEVVDTFKQLNQEGLVGKSTYKQLNESNRKHYEQQRQDKVKVNPIPKTHDKHYQIEIQVPKVKGYTDRHRDYEKHKEFEVIPNYLANSKTLPNGDVNNPKPNEPENKRAVKENHKYQALYETNRKYNSVNQEARPQPKEQPAELLEYNPTPITKPKGYTDRHRDEYLIRKQKLSTIQERLEDRSAQFKNNNNKGNHGERLLELAPQKKVLGYAEKPINKNLLISNSNKNNPNVTNDEPFGSKRNVSKSHKAQQRVSDKSNELNLGIKAKDDNFNKETAERNNAYTTRHRAVLQSNGPNRKSSIPNHGQVLADNKIISVRSELNGKKGGYVTNEKKVKSSVLKRVSAMPPVSV